MNQYMFLRRVISTKPAVLEISLSLLPEGMYYGIYKEIVMGLYLMSQKLNSRDYVLFCMAKISTG